jgi:colanic acid biosynthesis glycosyl transferase WcaI
LRILFISQLFDPENSIKGLEFARRLKALGHEVEVVTTFPSYPGGMLFPGYKQRIKQIDVVDGITVVRLPTFISHGKSPIKRVLSYASFGAVATLHCLFAARKPTAIYAYYPPVVVGFVAMITGKLRRVPFIYDVQDLWPEALVATGMVREGRLTRFVDKLCGFIYKAAARVVVLSDGYKRALVAKKVPAEKIERIFNWCDEARMSTDSDNIPDFLDAGYFNIVYAGNLGAAQALEHVVDAAALVQRSGDKQVRFVFIGAGVEKEMLQQRVQTLALDNVKFFPQVPVEQVSGLLARADVLLVHLADSKVFEITIPSKTQAHLMVGRPTLMAVKGEASRIVEDADAGMVIEPCQPHRLAEAALEISHLPSEQLQAMGERGRIYYQSRMSMDKGVRSIDQLLHAIAGKTP